LNLLTRNKPPSLPLLVLVLISIQTLSLSSAAAEEPQRGIRHFPLIPQATQNDAVSVSPAVGLAEWFSTAAAKWRISFPGSLSGISGKGESELDFDHLKSPVTMLTGRARINSLFSIDAAYGFGSISGGRGIDKDRFSPSNGTGFEYSRSESDVSGSVRMWQINLSMQTRRIPAFPFGFWGFVAGFLHYEDNLIMRNGVQIIPFSGPFSQALDSTYDFSWDTVKIGVTHQIPITGRFSSTLVLSLYPLVWYEGEGYWNLRTTGPDAFRSESPNFTQESSSGYGYEATLTLRYALTRKTDLSAGYRFFYLSARNGTDTLYYADGTTAYSHLDWVTVNRQGGYVELRVGF
jgi:hypothetical protein